LFAAAKFLVEATKSSFVAPNFDAVTKPFFPVDISQQNLVVKKRGVRFRVRHD